MLLTRETDYAIRIVDYLIQNNNLTSASKIAESTNVPLRFAKNILQKLAGHGIISSVKGVYGGYKLGRSPENISLYDVLDVTQGPIDLRRSLCEKQNKNRRGDKEYTYDDIFKELYAEMEHRLREIRFIS